MPSMALLVIPWGVFALIFALEARLAYRSFGNDRMRHAVPNLVIAGADTLLTGFLWLTLISWALRFVDEHSWGLLSLAQAPAAVKFILAFLLFDLWMYWWHRANHRIGILWLLHRAHHNDVAMDSTTALRFHPVEIVISVVLNSFIVLLFGLHWIHLIAYNLVFQPVIFFHHSNIALPERWDRRFRRLIVTPNMHRVHHSIEKQETDSDYGSVFSFWDRLFATFRKRADTRTITYGLPYFRDQAWHGLRGFLRIPFVRP